MDQQEGIQLIADLTKISENDIRLESKFIDDLNFDSLDVVELMMEVEDRYEIEIEEDELLELQTVEKAIDFVNSKLKDR